MEEEAEEVYRRAAIRVVDEIHDFAPHLVVVTGSSWSPAYSLIAAAWKRRYGTAGTPLPKRKHVSYITAEDIRGKKIVIFDEMIITGGTLRRASRLISMHKPSDVKLLGLIDREQRYKLLRKNNPEGDLGVHRRRGLYDYLSKLRGSKLEPEKVRYKKDMRDWAKTITKKRAELRRIASSIKPRE